MPDDKPSSRSATSERVISELRENNVGRLFLRASRHYSDAAMKRVRELGHPELTLTHASILPHIDLHGTRLVDLAKRAGLTKQSASELVSALQKLGYLDRVPDPADRRSQRVIFTARGKQFLLAAHQAKLELEDDLISRLGPEAAAELIKLLRGYLQEAECG